MKNLGALIKELRETNDWPQRKLAHLLDIDVSVLSRIENDNKFPRKRVHEIIRTISQLFNISEAELNTTYLSDEIATMLVYQTDYQSILKVSEQKVNYERAKKLIQSQIKFKNGNSN
jgi:transcriptional regulator with XRE-family HTH domain